MADWIWTNNAAVLLDVAIGPTDTSLTVTAGGGALFPSPAAGEYFAVTLESPTLGTREIVRCTARAGDTLTVARGQDGTVGQSWAAGVRVEHRITAEQLRYLKTQSLAPSPDAVARRPSAGFNQNIVPGAAGDTALTLQAATGQSAPLFKAVNASAAVTFQIDSGAFGSDTGYGYAARYSASGTGTEATPALAFSGVGFGFYEAAANGMGVVVNGQNSGVLETAATPVTNSTILTKAKADALYPPSTGVVLTNPPGAASQTVTAGNTAYTPLVVKGISSQTGDIFRVETAANPNAFEVKATGEVMMSNAASTDYTQLGKSFSAGAATFHRSLYGTIYVNTADIGMRMDPVAGSSLQAFVQFRNSAGAMLSQVDSNGKGTFAGLQVNGTTNSTGGITTDAGVNAAGNVTSGGTVTGGRLQTGSAYFEPSGNDLRASMPNTSSGVMFYGGSGGPSSAPASTTILSKKMGDTHYAAKSSLSGYVPTGRRVDGGSGISGGGTLASNVTLSIDAGYLNARWLPLSGGTVSGTVIIKGGGNLRLEQNADVRYNTAGGSTRILLGHDEGANESFLGAAADDTRLRGKTIYITNDLIQGGVDSIYTWSQESVNFDGTNQYGVRMSNGGVGIKAAATDSSTKVVFTVRKGTGPGNINYSILANGNYTGSSDAKLKENVEDLADATATLDQLRPVSFNWIDRERDDKIQRGLIAQEVQEVLPDLVTDVEGTLHMSYAGLIPLLLKAVQELSARVEELENQP